MYQSRNELVICEPFCTLILTRFQKRGYDVMMMMFDINIKRTQARFKKNIETKKNVDMNFLHFVFGWMSNAFFWVCLSWP